MKVKLNFMLMLLFIPIFSFAQQQIKVSGNVTEQKTGYPAIGVTVMVKGTTTGTVTDIDGNYTLDNVPGNGTIVFSYIGMTTVEEPVNGRSTINVQLAEDV
ncbi:MAG: carboxypeptidase-like regulatory domain-containing protein, partial [Petrimonas sp.]|nr:carboxypeptidase-like regulatory domain-containing protein [Petrimonas sp.]